MTSLAVAALVSQLLAAAAPAPAPAAAAVAADEAAKSAASAAASAEKSAAAVEKSAAAVEKAALAAEKAAEAAQKAAEAAATAAAKVTAPAPAPAPVPAPAAPAAPAEPAPGEPKPAVWTGAAAISLVSLTGNSESIALSVNAGAERKSESWILGLKANMAYGEARPATGGAWEVNALNASFQARGAFRFTNRYSAYLVGGIDTDHVASIEERPFGEAGVGILWLDEMEGDLSKLKLNTDVAFRYAKEIRFQYYPEKMNLPDVDIAAPRIGLAFRYALNKNVIFTEDAEVLPNILGEVRWLVNSNTKISARVVNPLSIYISLLVKYDSKPAQGKVDTDTALAFGVEAGF
ncbi:MAG: DUF481 domain-containing protein [Myxococcales bacterium]